MFGAVRIAINRLVNTYESKMTQVRTLMPDHGTVMGCGVDVLHFQINPSFQFNHCSNSGLHRDRSLDELS